MEITGQKTDYCQQIRDSQLTYFQVKVSEETGQSVVTNGSFATNLNFWTQTGLWLYSAPWGASTAVVGGQLTQQVILTANRTYRFDYDITLAADGARVVLIAPTSIGGTPIATQEGSYSAYFVTTLGGLQTIGFLNTAGITAFIRNVAIYLLSEPVFTLRECDTGTVQGAVGVVQRFEDKITYSASWTDVPDGCYQICLENAGDFEYNYAERALCLTLENSESLLAESGEECILWYG